MKAATKLTHDTIGNLQGGGIGAAIDNDINRAMRDCERRPSLKKPRIVTVQLEFTPSAGQALDGGVTALSTVGIHAKVAVKLPPQAGDTDFLHVSPGVSVNGEPETHAVFSQEGLFVARKEGN